jgi:hypothetical protein
MKSTGRPYYIIISINARIHRISLLYIFSGMYLSRQKRVYRGLARDVIHNVTDGRRHVGGIFFAPRMEITLENGQK